MKDNAIAAHQVLDELYYFIEDTFVSYFISLEAPKVWRPKLENHERQFSAVLKTDGYSARAIETCVTEQSYYIGDEECKIQTTTKRLRSILVPGYYEDRQAQNAIVCIYDHWESFYRVEIKNLLVGNDVSGDIWGDLRYIRHSISHHRSISTDALKKAKLIKDFLPGQKIVLTKQIMEKIRQEFDNWYHDFRIILCNS